MKKKYIIALLASMSLAMTACGADTETKKTDTAAEQQEDTSADEAETEEDEKEAEETEEKSAEPTRLVSVDNVEDYIKLGQYKGMELERSIGIVSDEDVEAQMLANVGAGEEVKDGTVQEGDIATIDYVGTMDGEEFDGGSAEAYDLEIGSGSFIEGFEDGIIGMKKGETKDLELTFPDYYPEDKAGKAVVFQVTVQKFTRPELNEDWVTENTEYKTMDEYREGVRQQLEEMAVQTAESAMKTSAWSKLLVDSEVIEYPEADVNNAIESYQKEIQFYADQAGMTEEEFLESQGFTQEQWDEQCQEYAELKVKQNLIVQGIMDAEGMKLNDEECLAIQQQMMEDLGIDELADLIDVYGQELVDESIGIIRVENFILDNAVIQEEVASGTDGEIIEEVDDKALEAELEAGSGEELEEDMVVEEEGPDLMEEGASEEEEGTDPMEEELNEG